MIPAGYSPMAPFKWIYITAAALMTVSVASAQTRLTGAGATFPEPLYKRWVAEYQKTQPQIAIDYQGIGSGGGIKGIIDRTIDFAASDAPMTAAQIQLGGGEHNLLEIPTCAGAVVPACNLPMAADFKFTADILAKIYLGKITNWNDPAITKLNPGLTLPNLPITPVYRADGSGTNFIFTSYLAAQSEEFKESIGIGDQVQWPVGQGGKGNPGVAAAIQQIPGSIGYIEQNFADKNALAYGSVQNRAGKFIKASPATVSAASTTAQFDGPLLAADIWNHSGDNAYPISSFTYLIVYRNLNNIRSPQQAQALAGFLWWATHDGQKIAADMDYAPLDPAAVRKVSEALVGLSYGSIALQRPQ
jgi:phosphate transport system substrate-binding protein